jgi:hypothetical protein
VLICPEYSAVAEAARAAGFEVEVISYRGDLDWRATKRIREILTRLQVDLVHVHSRRGADIWGGLAARKLGLPCVFPDALITVNVLGQSLPNTGFMIT